MAKTTLQYTAVLISCCLVPFLFRTVDAASKGSAIIGGKISIAFTPFDALGRLNLTIIPEYAKYLKNIGMDGVLVAAILGENNKITVDEAKQVILAWIKVGRALNLQIISQVGGIALPYTLELAKFSEEVGVDAILIVPDLYHRPENVNELIYYFKLIAKAAPNTLLMYHHIPQHTFVNLDIVEVFEQATKQITNFIGLKIEVYGDALRLQHKFPGKSLCFAEFQFVTSAVLIGYEDILLIELSLFPELFKGIFDKVSSCELNVTRALDQQLQAYRDVILQGFHFIPAMKEAFYFITGINVGPARKPEKPLTKEQSQDLKYRMMKAGIPLKVL